MCSVPKLLDQADGCYAIGILAVGSEIDQRKIQRPIQTEQKLLQLEELRTPSMPRPSTNVPPVVAGPPRYRCVECSHPVSSLFTIYSKDNVRLTQCVHSSLCPFNKQDKCKKFADKYIEHDFIVLFIDIILIKPQVYRHLLYNRLGTADDRLNVPTSL